MFKEYTRGGLLGRLGIGVSVSGDRPFWEITCTEAAAGRGVPTHRIAAGGWIQEEGRERCGLLVEEIEGATSLPEWLSTGRHGAGLRREGARRVGEVIGRLHLSGIVHGDLNLANILIREESRKLQCWVVDFDKASVQDRLSDQDRTRNLLRLYRSVQKWNRAGTQIGRKEMVLFLKSYCRESKLKFSEWQSLLRGDSPMFWLWRVKWALSDALGLSRVLPIGAERLRGEAHKAKN